MRRLYSKGLVASMEADLAVDNGETGGNIPAADVVGIDNSIQMEEVNQQAEVITSLEEDMAAAADASAEVTERLIPIVEAAKEEGGLGRPAADAVAMAAESLFAFAGVAASRINMPASESFGGRSTRVHQTNLAIEGIKETLQTVWENIKKALKKAWDWIKDQFAKFFGAAEGLKKRAENVEKKAIAMAGQTIENKTFDDGSLFKKLHVNGAVEAGSGAATVVKTAAGNLINVAAEFIKAEEGLLKHIDDGFTGLENAPAAPISFGSAVTLSATDKHGEGSLGLEVKSSSELPGGKAYIARSTKSSVAVGTDAIRANAAQTLKIDSFDPKKAEPTKETLTTLTTSQAEDIGKIIASAAGELMNFRKQKEKLEAMMEKINKSATKAADNSIKELAMESDSAPVAGAEGGTKPADGGDKSAKREALNAMKEYYARAPGRMVTPCVSVFQYCLATGKACLDYAEKSLAQHKAK